jgi:hypothetical protein
MAAYVLGHVWDFPPEVTVATRVKCVSEVRVYGPSTYQECRPRDSGYSRDHVKPSGTIVRVVVVHPHAEVGTKGKE